MRGTESTTYRNDRGLNMARIFIPIYRYLKDRRWLMYLLLTASSVLFLLLGLKVEYEEDITKLFPNTESSAESTLAFENLDVKDRITIQVTILDEGSDPSLLPVYCTEFVDSLMNRDPEGIYMQDVLHRIDDDMLMTGMDYVMEHIPSFIDESMYSSFDSLLTNHSLKERMKENYQMVMEDVDGSVTTAVSTDPAGLLRVLLPDQSKVKKSGFGIYDGQIVTADSTVAFAFLDPAFESSDSKSGEVLVSMIEDEVKKFTSRHPDSEILFHGSVIQSVNNSRRIKRDLLLTIGISLIFISVVIGVTFRNKSSLPLIIAPVAWGTFFALAVIWLIKGSLSLMAMGLGAIVLGVALSYCLHMMTHYKYVSEPEIVIRDQSTPVILGWVTTIGAFLSLTFTGSELLRDFGLFASLAITGTVLFALVFLPHFLRPERNRKSKRMFRMIDRINAYPYDKVRWLRYLIVAFCVVCIAFSFKVGFDSDIKNIGYNEKSAMMSQELYRNKMSGTDISVCFASCADDLDSAIEKSREISGILDGLKAQGLISGHNDLSRILVTESEQESRIAKWNEYWNDTRIAELKDIIGRQAEDAGLPSDMFTPFFNMIEGEYTAGSLYEAGIIPETLMSNVIDYAGGKYLVLTNTNMPPHNKEEVCKIIDDIDEAIVVDSFFYTSSMISTLNDDFNRVLGISSILVFIILLLSFRNIPVAVLAFLPMMLSWYVVKGVMGMLGVDFNMINIVIATFIFGIGVDYSIFILKGLINFHGYGENDLMSYHKAAISLSAFTMIIVLGSLLFARHPAISSIGLTSLIGMLSTILITYAIVPALFRLMMRMGLLKSYLKNAKK